MSFAGLFGPLNKHFKFTPLGNARLEASVSPGNTQTPQGRNFVSAYFDSGVRLDFMLRLGAIFGMMCWSPTQAGWSRAVSGLLCPVLWASIELITDITWGNGASAPLLQRSTGVQPCSALLHTHLGSKCGVKPRLWRDQPCHFYEMVADFCLFAFSPFPNRPSTPRRHITWLWSGRLGYTLISHKYKINTSHRLVSHDRAFSNCPHIFISTLFSGFGSSRPI